MNEPMRIEGSAQALLEEVCRALALGELVRPARLPTRRAQSPTSDLILDMFKATRPLGREIRFAADQTLLYVLKMQDSPSAEEVLRLADALRDTTDSVLKTMGLEPWQLSPQERKMALEDAGELFREIGLEHHDMDLMLATHPDVGEGIAAHPVHPFSAHIWLEGRIFQRLETFLFTDPLLGLERLASSWWFSTLSASRFDAGDFTQTVREQEWSLLDRDSLVLGAPVLDAFLNSGFSDSLPPRQQRLAAALQDSFVSGFVVVERDGTSAVFEEIVRGRRIEVYEHGADTVYEVGWIGLGRVCAFDGPVHLRSPGMAFLSGRPGLAETVKEELQRGRRALPAAVRVEAILSMVLGEKELPRPLAPAASRREAKRLLGELTDALEDAGLAEDAGGSEGISFLRYDLDAPTGAWMKALDDYAKRGPLTKPKSTGKKKRTKKRRSK